MSTTDQHSEPTTVFADLPELVAIQPEATVSRTVLSEAGTRLVLFGFDANQELTEHTAAMPVLMQVLDGELTISAAGRSDVLRPGGLIYLDARVPHSVVAATPSHLLLTMLDSAPKE